MKVLVLMRGVPGAGKSTEARQIAEQAESAGKKAIVLSTDDYFMKEVNGEKTYVYNGDLIMKAHAWNDERVGYAMRNGVDVVIVDNTHTRPRECYSAVEKAYDYGYDVEFAESKSPWWLAAKETLAGKRNEKTLGPHVKVFASKNTHGVPESTIFKMLNRYHLNITVDDVIGAA